MHRQKRERETERSCSDRKLETTNKPKSNVQISLGNEYHLNRTDKRRNSSPAALFTQFQLLIHGLFLHVLLAISSINKKKRNSAFLCGTKFLIIAKSFSFIITIRDWGREKQIALYGLDSTGLYNRRITPFFSANKSLFHG